MVQPSRKEAGENHNPGWVNSLVGLPWIEGQRLGSRTPEGREWYRRYFESAITVPGARFDLDVIGRYTRPDIFPLKVNTSPHAAVSLAPTCDPS